MNRNTLILFFITTLFFGGCSLLSQSTQAPTVSQKKNINTTLEGTIVQAATGFAIQTGNPNPTRIDSYEVPIQQYLQQNVRVTGQYSGDTLFVDTIEKLQ